MGRQQLWEWISYITIQKKSYEGLKMLFSVNVFMSILTDYT